MPEDIFGLSDTPIDERFDWLADEDPAASVEEEQPAPLTDDPAIPSLNTEAEVQANEPEASTEEVEETPEEKPYRWANKYESPEKLEDGYRELSDLWRRTSERSRVLEQQNNELLTRQQALMAQIQQALPYVQAAVQAQRAPRVDEYGQPIAPPAPSPAEITALVRSQVQRETSAQQAQIREELAAERERQEALSTVQQFYAETGITYRDERDNALAETISYLNDAWGSHEVNVASRESLNFVLEASERPALRQVLMFRPELFDSEAGMQLARMEASVLEGNAITQQQTAVPASQVGATDGQRKPVTERASGGAGALPSADPSGDPWLEAVAAYRNEQGGRKSVFFE